MGSPELIMVSSVSLTSNKITWEEVDFHLRNGRIIEYIVIISNNSMTYNLTSSERYVIVNDLVFGNVYNMSIAGVNSIGRGPFSDPVEVQIGSGKYNVSSLSVFVNNNYTSYSVPGPVSMLSSLMSTTWAVISWSVPSYILVNYPIITYEIGYTTHQSNGSCSPSDEFSPMIKTNTSNRNVYIISDLIGNSCYLFGVRGYTINGYGLWRVIGNITKSEGNCRQSEIYHFTICFHPVSSSNIGTITVLGVLVGILFIVVIVSVVGNILLLLYVRKYVEDIMILLIKNLHFADSNHWELIQLKEQTVGKLSFFCYLVLTHILSIYRPDEDIEINICELYSLHQSKPTDDIYNECQQPVETSVY